MIIEREFLDELYKRRIYKVYFIEYFRKDKYLKNSLFGIYKTQRKSFTELKFFEILEEVHNEIKDFQNVVLDKANIDYLNYSESFAKSLIYKLESCSIPHLTNLILTDFINNAENTDLEASYIVGGNDYTFKQQYGITISQAKTKYRELKRYANNFLVKYLKTTKIQKKQLIEKFKHIGYLDYKEVIINLKKHDTTTKKLDYLRKIKEDYYDKYELAKKSIEDEVFFHYYHTVIWERIFGNFSLLSPLHIQEPVYTKFFKNGLNEPEFTYWFLMYNAEFLYPILLKNKTFEEKINSSLRIDYIKAELKELNDEEQKAKKLLKEKKIDPYKDNNPFELKREVELLRVLDGNYYKKNVLPHVHSVSNITVQYYAKYYLFKPYLEKLLNKKSEQQNDKIKAVFNFIDFLHLNSENFKNYIPIVERCLTIQQEISTLDSDNNFEDEIKYKQLNKLKNKEFSEVFENVTQVITNKALELDICNKTNFGIEINWGYTEIRKFKDNATQKDLSVINSTKTKYLEFKRNTNNSDFLSLTFFFSQLHKYLKELFVFFDNSAKAEFEIFETKTIKVNSIEEAIKGLKQGHTKFTLPNTFLSNPLNNEQPKNEGLPPQPNNDVTKEQLLNERNNLIPDVSIEEVYKFFKVLVEKPNRKGKFYLNEQKLLKFIKSTFIDECPIKQKFDVPFSKDKIDVRSVFRRFQDYCYDLEYNKKDVKDKYFAIMFEGFEGFSKTADFNKWHITNNKLPTSKRQKAK